jgi:hypothetical protein
MSMNTTTAHAQGVQSAQGAAAAMLASVFDEYDQIWLDIEAYDTSNASCKAAVNAYVDGWSEELGFISGVYGAASASAVNSWWNLDHRPNSVWIAAWNVPTYPNTVWGLSPVSDSRWTNAQRMHQYRGVQDSDTTQRFAIDMDCANAWIDRGAYNSGYDPSAETCIGPAQPNNPY